MNKIGENKFNDAFVMRRKLAIPTIQGIDSTQVINKSFADGVGEVVVGTDSKKIWITYDASQIGFGVIENILSDCGFPVSDSWWSRYKCNWYRYQDENALANSTSRGGACCSNPSDLYARRRK